MLGKKKIQDVLDGRRQRPPTSAAALHRSQRSTPCDVAAGIGRRTTATKWKGRRCEEGYTQACELACALGRTHFGEWVATSLIGEASGSSMPRTGCMYGRRPPWSCRHVLGCCWFPNTIVGSKRRFFLGTRHGCCCSMSSRNGIYRKSLEGRGKNDI